MVCRLTCPSQGPGSILGIRRISMPHLCSFFAILQFRKRKNLVGLSDVLVGRCWPIISSILKWGILSYGTQASCKVRLLLLFLKTHGSFLLSTHSRNESVRSFHLHNHQIISHQIISHGCSQPLSLCNRNERVKSHYWSIFKQTMFIFPN